MQQMIIIGCGLPVFTPDTLLVEGVMTVAGAFFK